MEHVVDVDIKGFFDNIDHGWMMEILRKYTTKRYILLYCERWLKAPVKKINGELNTDRSKGTPQGIAVNLRIFLVQKPGWKLEIRRPILNFEITDPSKDAYLRLP
jgi:retron-type reverse transcriptase